MGLFNRVFGSSEESKSREIQAKGFEISSCSDQCDDCIGKFPKSIKVEEEANLWNSTNPYGLHIVVATGKTDWPHDATGVSKTLAHSVAKYASKYETTFNFGVDSSKIKVNVGSVSSKQFESNEDYINGTVGDVLLLPFFIWIKNLNMNDVEQVLNSVIANLIDARAQSIKPILNYQEFPNIKIEIDENDSHIFLCSHKTRDKRCGLTAPIMKKEMDIYLRDLGKYRDFDDVRPGGVSVSFINHIGGHKYAANVLIYLKNGKNIWLANCKPNNVKPIIDECILNGGKVWPDKIRIIQKFNSISW